MVPKYILKIKGAVKIPDYIEIRDEDFTLIGYFRADRPEAGIAKLGLSDSEDVIKAQIEEIDFGRITELKMK